MLYTCSWIRSSSFVLVITQGKLVLAASNDYAARIWGVHDQKIRVSGFTKCAW